MGVTSPFCITNTKITMSSKQSLFFTLTGKSYHPYYAGTISYFFSLSRPVCPSSPYTFYPTLCLQRLSLLLQFPIPLPLKTLLCITFKPSFLPLSALLPHLPFSFSSALFTFLAPYLPLAAFLPPPLPLLPCRPPKTSRSVGRDSHRA